MGLNRRDILLLIVIWILLAAIIGVVVIILRQAGGGTGPVSEEGAVTVAATPTFVPVYTPVASQATAQSLYPLAQAAAAGWQPDAELLSVRASWENTAINLVGQPVQWTYRFYSEQLGTLYFVTVTPEGQVKGIQHLRRLERRPPALPVDSWLVDSPAALTNWLNAGGGDFLGSRPGIEVTAQLGLRTEGDSLEWTLVGYDQQDGAYVAVTVQAESGETQILK